MKKYLLFLVAIMLATVARAATITFTDEGIKYTVYEEDKTAVVKGYENVSGEVNIPSIITFKYDRYAVVTIADHAFQNCKSMTSVTLPESLTKIGTGAFEGCSNLTSVNIPNKVQIIPESAFENCSSLTSATIPESVIQIGNQAFYHCHKLASVTIPNSVTKIGKWAFSDCLSLPSVTIPEAVTEIGDGPFSMCISLKEIIVEAGNKYYCADNGALYNHDMTTLIQCPGSKTEFDIPISVTSIGNYALIYCNSLTSVTIPNSVKSIGIQAFSFCTSLTSVTIPNSVTEIDDYAFYGCDGLNSVVIGSSVKSIGKEGFYGCVNLTKITDLSEYPQSVGTETFKDVPNNAVIYIPKGSYVSYMVAKGWEQFSDFREMGAFSVSISASTLELEKGKSAELSVAIEKDDDVTVGDYEWTSSNPEVATVEDGKVNAIAPGDAVITYTVYDGYGVAHTVSCEVSVKESSDIADISDEATELADVFTLQGIPVLRNVAVEDIHALPVGLYIVRQGNSVKKIAVK